MQHVLNVAFEFDDERIKELANRAAELEMDRIIRQIVMDEIAPETSGWYGKPNRSWDKVWDILEDHIKDIIAEHTEEIIERASNKLVQSVRNTKAWKERFKDVLEETV